MTTRKTKSTSKRSARKPTKSPARGGRKARSKKTTGLKVRMYRVGFGDFFLVTVPTAKGDQYILIDCGVFKGTSGTGDIGSIVDAVEDMYKTTKGHLALVIMTHRHADHIAGFAKAKRFQDFTASMVWMPYWEKFNDEAKAKAKKETENKSLTGDEEEEDENEAYNLLSAIDEIATNLALQFRGREDAEGKEALAQLGNATGIEDFNAVATAKKKGGSNAIALDMLKKHLGDNGKNVRYYAADDEPELPSELKGLKATILGPPPRKAKAFLALMDLKKGVGQYLDSRDGDESAKGIKPFSYEWKADFEKDYPAKDPGGYEIKYNEVAETLNKSQPDMLLAAASKIENFLNNQSLVVLFEFDGKRLLFAGDAQGGNWEYWLYKTDEPVKDPTKAGDLVERSKELLETIDFYKVGHHGSTNATPIQAIEAAIARPQSGNGFVAMCSTEVGVYGNPDKDTEVPRSVLMDVIEKGSCLLRSDAIPITFTDAATGKKVDVKPRAGVKLPAPKAGKVNKNKLYLEYEF
ncbi:MAG TPA: hypothetical protein VLB46_10810 [Pyrinomonadaceae bacterium]|nr:hypothetical protein [Pyrinomonadaceae bacterium]